MSDQIAFEFAIYYLPEPTKDPLAELDVLLRTVFSDFQRVENTTEQPTRPSVFADIKTDVSTSFAPPDLHLLRHSGQGLSREQAEALQESRMALVLDFTYSKENVWNGMRSALRLTDSLARKTGGLIWDEETREAFSPDAWKQQRIDDWSEAVPDLSTHTKIHAYKKDDHEYVRGISLGMAKFGLPDVVIDNFSWSQRRNIGSLITLFSQAIAEGATVPRTGEFDLDLKAIRNEKVREPQRAALLSNATGMALLSLRQGTWENGDPMNRLIEITFDRSSGPDLHARQEQLLSRFFGWEDSITPVRHDEELEAASQQARKQLPRLRTALNKGLAPGEFIQFKAPFDTADGGHEWMWVDVIAWDGGRIKGLLKNEPFNIADLHAGQVVEIAETEVFDYIHTSADGTSDGNETGKLISRRSEKLRDVGK
jgi:uncharacterized protein YegJ (DUF2314 family)